jgi:hypothetical protein
MSFISARDGVIARLRTCTPALYPDTLADDLLTVLKRSNVTPSDDSIIDVGVTAWAICYMGTEEVLNDVPAGYFGRIYEIRTELGVRYTKEKDTNQALAELVDLVNEKFSQHPHTLPVAVPGILKMWTNGHDDVYELQISNTKSVVCLWTNMSIKVEWRSRIRGGEFR